MRTASKPTSERVTVLGNLQGNSQWRNYPKHCQSAESRGQQLIMLCSVPSWLDPRITLPSSTIFISAFALAFVFVFLVLPVFYCDCLSVSLSICLSACLSVPLHSSVPLFVCIDGEAEAGWLGRVSF